MVTRPGRCLKGTFGRGWDGWPSSVFQVCILCVYNHRWESHGHPKYNPSRTMAPLPPTPDLSVMFLKPNKSPVIFSVIDWKPTFPFPPPSLLTPQFIKHPIFLALLSPCLPNPPLPCARSSSPHALPQRPQSLPASWPGLWVSPACGRPHLSNRLSYLLWQRQVTS